MKNVLLILVPILLFSCAKSPELPTLNSADSLAIVQDNIAHRAEAEDFFANAPGSPFVRDTTIEFHGVKWYPINARFRGLSTLHRYANPETVVVMGTKGEERRQLRYGYFEFVVPDTQGNPATIRINAYKFTPYDKKRYEMYRENLSVWFTDRTTGKETYHVGRYVEIGDEQPDPDHLYTIDLNKAYNPYCAYSDMFSCAIPRKEDHIDLAIRAGELKYHD